MMNKDERYDRVIRAIREVATNVLPEGSEVSLFGSRARGDAREDSDWDVHILVEGPDQLPLTTMRKYAWPFEKKGYEMEEWINVVVHSFSRWNKYSFLPLYKNIKKDGIKL